MGAAATLSSKNDVDSNSKSPSSSTSRNLRNSSSMPVCCVACKTQLGFFKRKKCPGCLQMHCARCLLLRPTCIDGRPTCAKCRALLMGDYTRDFLASHYTVRELRAFLTRQRVAMKNCTEKHDLVELVMQQRRSASDRSDSEEHSRHISQLRENCNLQAGSQATGTSPSSSVDPVSAQNNGNSRERPSHLYETSTAGLSVGHTGVESSSQPMGSSGDIGGQPTEQSEPTYQNVPEQSNNEPSDQSPMEDDTGVRGNDDTSQLQSGDQRLTLADIKCSGDIDGLTVRQLKGLLVNNYVDYKGCCEKQELVERVHQLWAEHTRTNKKAGDGAEYSLKEEDLCKVCMDAAIDCILLECGHMVACTGCGKRLAECPICRRYVSRVVHVFRA